jgi:hypothetical protein
MKKRRIFCLQYHCLNQILASNWLVKRKCPEIDDRVGIGDDEFSSIGCNIGKGKLYPGGPTCEFKNKIIPCMVEFSPGGLWRKGKRI